MGTTLGWRFVLGLFITAIVEVSPAWGAVGQPMPRLMFTPPLGFIGEGLFFSENAHDFAIVRISHFRPLASNSLESEISGSLLREWHRNINRQITLVGEVARERVPV